MRMFSYRPRRLRLGYSAVRARVYGSSFPGRRGPVRRYGDVGGDVGPDASESPARRPRPGEERHFATPNRLRGSFVPPEARGALGQQRVNSFLEDVSDALSSVAQSPYVRRAIGSVSRSVINRAARAAGVAPYAIRAARQLNFPAIRDDL